MSAELSKVLTFAADDRPNRLAIFIHPWYNEPGENIVLYATDQEADFEDFDDFEDFEAFADFEDFEDLIFNHLSSIIYLQSFIFNHG